MIKIFFTIFAKQADFVKDLNLLVTYFVKDLKIHGSSFSPTVCK